MKTGKGFWIGIVIIIVVTASVYLNSLHGAFNLDDISGIINNRSIHIESLSLLDLGKAMASTRPFSDLTLALNYYFGGFNVVGYHVINIAIHCVTAVLLYIFLLKSLAGCSTLIALLGSLLWAVHPVQTQAVTYIIQRMTSLATMFFMLSLVLYIQARDSGGKKQILFFLLAAAAGFLAMGSKQIAITLPFIILLYEFYFRARFDLSSMKPLLKYVTVLLVVLLLFMTVYFKGHLISGIYAVLTGQYIFEEYTVMQRLLTETRVVIYYLSLLILPLPSRLNLDHDFVISTSLMDPLTTLPSVVSILVFIVVAIRIATKYPPISFGILWFLINLVLESTIIKLDIIFEHRLYLPSIGIFFGMTWILSKMSESAIDRKGISVTEAGNAPARQVQRIGAETISEPLGNFRRAITYHRYQKMGIAVLTFGVIGFYSLATVARNAVWHDSISIWQDAIHKAPTNPRARNNLGVLYLRQGELDFAQRELEGALRLDPSHLIYRENLAIIYQRKDEIQKAIDLFIEARDADPFNPYVHINLGKIYYKNEQMGLATIAMEKAVSLDPKRAISYSLLGRVYQKSGQTEKAAMMFEKSLDLAGDEGFELKLLHPLAEEEEVPDKLTLHHQLGQIYAELGENSRAIEHYKEVIEILPVFVPARLELAALYRRNGQMDLAEKEFQKILEIDPNFGNQ